MNVKVTLECEISKSGLKVEWYKGDKKIRRDETYDISADGKVHRLVIEKATEAEAGSYSACYEKLKTTGKLSFAGEYRHFLGYSSFCVALHYRGPISSDLMVRVDIKIVW